MTRGAQVTVILLLVAVLGFGGVLIARSRQGGLPPSPSNLLVVFAPCGLSGPLNGATPLFRQSHPGIEVEVVYDNANVLVNRVRRGELGDLFISPGELEMRQLAQEGYIDPSSVRDFGSLDMVVIASPHAKGLDSIDDLTSPSVKYISLADPESNSVGHYGQRALQSLGLWEELQPKLLLPGAPLDAIKVVEAGDADAGLAYLTCPLDTAPEKASKSSLRILAKIPRDKYPPVRLQLGVFNKTTRQALAQQFVDFMTSKQAQQQLAANGVLPVEKIR